MSERERKKEKERESDLERQTQKDRETHPTVYARVSQEIGRDWERE